MDIGLQIGLFIFSIIAFGVYLLYLPNAPPSDVEAEILYREYNKWEHHCKNNGCEIGKIHHIKQIASTGTKAYVTWQTRKGTDAIWVKGGRVSKNQIVVLCGNYSYGGHHNENVYYVNSFKVLPRNIIEGWEIHKNNLPTNGQ